MLSIYYAHSKMIYNTKREDEEVTFLRTIFKEVLCPNKDIGEKGAIEPYLKKVRECTGLVCSECQGHIWRGVFSEVSEALKTNMEVFCLRKYEGQYILRPVEGVEIVDEFDWKVEYGKVILKSLLGKAKEGVIRERNDYTHAT